MPRAQLAAISDSIRSGTVDLDSTLTIGDYGAPEVLFATRRRR